MGEFLRFCSWPGGCTVLVEKGRCKDHERKVEQYRGSSASRGYNSKWRAFIDWFRNQLLAMGIAPICGASMPGGPKMPSECVQRGIAEARRLHLHHDPPLQAHERKDEKAICDPLRVGFLCHRCHSIETARSGGLA